MKKFYLSILSFMLVAVSFATVHTITNSGQTFTPDSIAIEVGDSVDFSIGATHDVFQYESAKFNNASFSASDATQNGFTLPSGGGMITDHVTLFIPGTYYFVCSPHFGNGMKGKITVNHGTPVASCSEPFFSQYMEGSGSNKAIEIFNPSNSAIDLSLYSLVMYNNGGNQVNTLSLSGSLAAGETYVISKSGSDVDGIADLIDGIMNHNGDDAYALVKNGVGAVDIMGEFYNDPGSAFNLTGGSMANNTLVRKVSVNAGTTDWSMGMTQWDVLPSNDTTGFGSHSFNPCLVGPVISFKTDSFIFNEGDGAIHLDTLLINPAIASPVAESFEIHLDAASTASAADFNLTITAPITLPFTYDFSIPFIPNFTAMPLDATLVDDALIEGTEWFKIVLRNGMNGLNIGSDSTLWVQITDNDFPADTFVEMTSNMVTVNEADGTYSLDLDYQQLSSNVNHTVDVQMISGDAADIGSFTTQTITFSSISESATITITDDALLEDNDTIMFALVNATNGLMIGTDSIFTLIIEDNDYPYYPIDMLRGNDASAVADSIGVKCWTSGYILGEDLGSSNREFTIHNGTKGMGVFIHSSLGDFGYTTITEGDSVMILGTVAQFNGFSQMSIIDTMYMVGTSTIQMPTVVTDTLGEYTESELITIERAEIVSGTWGDNQTITIESDGIEYSVRIDGETGVGAMAEPNGLFNITGLGGQFNFSTTDLYQGYQLKPRYVADIELLPTVGMSGQGSSVGEDAGTVTIEFTVANDNGGTYTVDVDLTNQTGSLADIDNFTMITGVAVSGGTGSFDVTITDDTEIETNEGFEFTLMNPSAGLLLGNNNKYELTIIDDDANAIDEINVNDLKLYPNPSTDMLTLELVSNENQVSTLRIIDVLGRVVMTESYILNRGNNSISINVSQLSKGTYSLEIGTEAGKHVESLQIR